MDCHNCRTGGMEEWMKNMLIVLNPLDKDGLETGIVVDILRCKYCNTMQFINRGYRVK